MNTATVKKLPIWSTRSALWRNLRIGSGLVLFAYVCVHFSNHALGLYSAELMTSVGDWLKPIKRTLLVSIILYGALLIHFSLALASIALRTNLKMPTRDWMQLLSGLAIPFLLSGHVIGTRYASSFYGLVDGYTYVLLSTFVFAPFSGVLDVLGLLAAWIHGCVGMHMWARFKAWYSPNFMQVSLVIAAVLPVLSLAGYLSAAREIAPLASDGEFLEAYYARLNIPDDSIWAMLADDKQWANMALIAAIGVALAAFFIGVLWRQRHKLIEIDYLDGSITRQRMGPTLLEISKRGGIGHANVCGGRGRCSTCRVRVLENAVDLPPASPEEARVLSRVRAPEDVRLACQIRPQGNMKVMRILPAETSLENALDVEPFATGTERLVTVMFADLRNFTATSEAKLPFDVVYLINQFSNAMGQAVETNGGRIDKFLGDGFMALFGVEGDAESGARNALAASAAMLTALNALNERLAGDLETPLRIGVGLHAGTVILGEMGYGTARRLTALGDTVNVASRLESATKTLKCTVCVSQDTTNLAGYMPDESRLQSISVRGKRTKIPVYGVSHPDELGSKPRPIVQKGKHDVVNS